MFRRQFLKSAVLLGLSHAINRAALSKNNALKVTVFPGAQNLALWAALDKGFFEKNHLSVELHYTMNSDDLRNGLSNGTFDLAHSAVDNSLAIVDYKNLESVILMGGDSSLNELYVQDDIQTLQDMRGKTLVVDAPNTAYALQVKKALDMVGVQETEYKLNPVGRTALRLEAMQKDKNNSASTLNPPFSFQAQKAGFHSLGRLVDLIGPYQGQGLFAMRSWINQHPQELIAYISSFIESVRWSLDPKNKDEAIQILMNRAKLDVDLANASYGSLVTPNFGLDVDARFSEAGFKNLLSIRSEFGHGKKLPEEKLVDLSFYEKALQSINHKSSQ